MTESYHQTTTAIAKKNFIIKSLLYLGLPNPTAEVSGILLKGAETKLKRQAFCKLGRGNANIASVIPVLKQGLSDIHNRATETKSHNKTDGIICLNISKYPNYA